MKYKAVMFDLFGTLVDNYGQRKYHEMLGRMAAALGVPADAFDRAWKGHPDERFKGVFNSTEGYLEHICQELGSHPTGAQIKCAAEIRFACSVESLKPRADAVRVISTLKSRRHKLGLISDCSSEVPTLWTQTPFAPLFDVAIFSCVVGMRKPDPRIYLLATERLGVKPQECLHVGDGSSQELTGAARVGMTPVLIRVPDDAGGDAYTIDREEWDGAMVASLAEVLELAV